jgi:methylated-DNA-[protein]-cysteine S-methyltransferase
MKALQLKMNSKIGPLFLVASEHGLHGVFWRESNIPFVEGDNSAAEKFLNLAVKEITEYLNGDRKTFSVPLVPIGTEFQMKVWKELAKIPYGETRSYKDIALALNDANASRAVGTANGKNPISIIIPCHRVISSDGTLGGYAGGLDIKKTLLELEGSLSQMTLSNF